MNILLEENLRMRNIPLSLVLEKKLISKNKETGEETEKWVNEGYYSNFEALLSGYLRKSLTESKAQSLKELQSDIKKIENNIEKAIKEIKRSDYN